MLAVVELTKRYSSIPAVSEVSFTVEPGKVLGYLGPNGSGKSTTVKMLTGLLLPSQGRILYRGRDIQQQLIEYKSTLGYVPEDAQLYNYLTGREYLQLVGRLRGLPPKILDRKIDDLLQLFSLYKSRHSALSSYSKGMRQKDFDFGGTAAQPGGSHPRRAGIGARCDLGARFQKSRQGACREG